jgi:hypothetical protein
VAIVLAASTTPGAARVAASRRLSAMRTLLDLSRPPGETDVVSRLIAANRDVSIPDITSSTRPG